MLRVDLFEVCGDEGPEARLRVRFELKEKTGDISVGCVAFLFLVLTVGEADGIRKSKVEVLVDDETDDDAVRRDERRRVDCSEEVVSEGFSDKSESVLRDGSSVSIDLDLGRIGDWT